MALAASCVVCLYGGSARRCCAELAFTPSAFMVAAVQLGPAVQRPFLHIFKYNGRLVACSKEAISCSMTLHCCAKQVVAAAAVLACLH
jgi:hypothetical protein